MSKEIHKNIIKRNNRNNNNLNIEDTNTMIKLNSPKSENNNKVLRTKENQSSNLKNGTICNTIRTYSTKDLILYIQNNNNSIYNNYTTYINNNNNSSNKMKGNTKRVNNKKK